MDYQKYWRKCRKIEFRIFLMSLRLLNRRWNIFNFFHQRFFKSNHIDHERLLILNLEDTPITQIIMQYEFCILPIDLWTFFKQKIVIIFSIGMTYVPTNSKYSINWNILKYFDLIFSNIIWYWHEWANRHNLYKK